MSTLEYKARDWHHVIVDPVPIDSGWRSGWRDHIKWCTEMWGADSSGFKYQDTDGTVFYDRGLIWLYDGDGNFLFERSEDAALFTLRWS